MDVYYIYTDIDLIYIKVKIRRNTRLSLPPLVEIDLELKI